MDLSIYLPTYVSGLSIPKLCSHLFLLIWFDFDVIWFDSIHFDQQQKIQPSVQKQTGRKTMKILWQTERVIKAEANQLIGALTYNCISLIKFVHRAFQLK